MDNVFVMALIFSYLATTAVEPAQGAVLGIIMGVIRGCGALMIGLRGVLIPSTADSLCVRSLLGKPRAVTNVFSKRWTDLS